MNIDATINSIQAKVDSLYKQTIISDREVVEIIKDFFDNNWPVTKRTSKTEKQTRQAAMQSMMNRLLPHPIQNGTKGYISFLMGELCWKKIREIKS